MAKLAAIAAGPVGFTDSTGRQLSIPVSSLYFENGVLKFSPAPVNALSQSTQASINTWLNALAQAGLIVPASQPPAPPALVITAKDPGSTGNTIQIAISNVRADPTDSTVTLFDATVTEADVYDLLTPATLTTVLGTAPGGGSKPGLVFVSSAGAPAQPQNGDYVMAGDPATVDIPKADGTPGAFSLTSKAGGADAALTKVTVSNADNLDQPGTFTLATSWTKPATALDASDLQTAFGYEITVAPPSGGSLAAPAPGTFMLSGGAEPRAAAQATATLPANQ